MSIARHTSLKTLLEKSYISRRTFNALDRLGYTTLDSILTAAAVGVRFSSLPGLGRKAEAEIRALTTEARLRGITSGGSITPIGKDHESPVTAVIRQAMESLPTTYRSILDSEPDGIRAIERMLTDGIEAIMAVPASMPRLRVVARRKALIALAVKAADLAACSDLLAGTGIAAGLTETAAAAPDPTGFNATDEWEHFISPLRKQIILRHYILLKAGLSARASNLMESARISLQQMIGLFDAPESEYHRLCPGRIMKKSLGEICVMNERLAATFREVSQSDDRQATMWAAQFFFPFLFGPSRRFVVDYYTMHGHVPLFLLICSYLRSSDHRSDRIYCEARGIIDNHPLPLKTVAARYGLSCERVRQIVEAGPAMLATDWYRCYRPQELYPDVFSAPYLSTAAGSPLERICALESPQASLRGLLHICSLTVEASMYEYGDFAIALRGDLAAKTGGKALFDRIESIIQQRRNAPERRSIHELVDEAGYDAGDSEVTDVALHMAVHCFGCEAAGGDDVLLPRTWVDVATECIDILRQAGHPLHIDEIFSRFRRRFPTHKFTEPEQLRRLLWTDERARAVGKRSTYGLSEWDHIYFGSMRDLLRECMEDNDSPVPLDRLVDYVREHYPDATTSSIYASLVGDHLGRFVQYADGFGLSSKTYAGHTPRR